MSTAASRERLGRWAYWLQRFGLSSAFLWLACGRARPYLDLDAWHRLLVTLAHHPMASARGMMWLEGLMRDGLLLAFDLLVALLLVVSRPAPKPPERLSHVVVPLLSTFSYLGFGLAGSLPAWAQTPRLLPPLGLLGVVLPELLVVLAYVLSLSALVYLRRSFAIFVEARTLVRRGPYRFVRHPMYLGYVLVVLALAIARPTPAMWLLGALAIALTYLRARLEEKMLSAHTPGYAEWMAQTGMIFPRLRRRKRG